MPLSLLLLHAALAAPTELTLWHAYRAEEKDALDQLIAQYNAAHTDVVVTALAVPYDSFRAKLEAAAPRGNGPDLFLAAHERVGAWAQEGLIAPVTVDPTPYHPATVAAFQYQGQTWGVPLAWKCLALFYNRDLIPSPPATTDDLLTFARGFKAEGRFGLAYEATTPYYHAPWLYGFGGGIFQGDTVALDQPGNAASTAFVLDLLQEGLIPDEPTSALVTQLFNDGRAAMVVNGPWFLGEIKPGLNVGVGPLPVVSATGQAARPLLTVEGALISAYAAHPQEARELGLWLSGLEPSVLRATKGRQGVAALAAYDDPRVSGDPILAAFRAQLDHTEPMPNLPAMSATWEPMAKALRRALRGAETPEEAAASAQAEYRVTSKPPPPEVDATPFWAGIGLLVAGGLVVLARRIYTARAEIRAWSFAYGWVGPAAVGMGLLVVVPFVVGCGVSLFEMADGQLRFVGLANFLDIALVRDWPITSPLSFYMTLLVTILWTAANVALHTGIGLALAMILREPWVRLRALWRVLLIVPWAVPNYITALLWKGMFNKQFGAINGLLGWFGLEPVSWFSNFWTAFTANLTTNTWLGFPFMMVVSLGALQAIPRELEQAADLDGATGWQRFRHVTWPMLQPALLPAIILGSVWTFNMFNIVFLVSGGEPDGSTDILIAEAYRWAFTRGHRYGYASAYAVLIFLVLVGYTRLTNRMMARKGLA